MLKLNKYSAFASVILSLALVSQAQAETTIRMWSFLDPAKDSPRERVLRQLISEFEQNNPDVKIEVEPQVWSQIANKFTIAASTGNAPDIAWINYPSLVLPFSANAAADLSEVAFGDWTQSDWDDFVTLAPFDAVTVDGKILAAPIMLLSNTILYRKDLFEAAGVVPNDLSTWDGLLKSGKALTKQTDGSTTWGLGFPLSRDGASQSLVVVGLADLQESLFDDKCVPTVNTAAGEQALAMAADFIKEGVTSPEAVAQTSDDSQEVFIGGQQAITIGGTSRVNRIREKAVFDKNQLGVLSWPSWTGEKPGPYILDGWTAVVWSGSDHKDEAGAFVAFMTGEEAATKWTLEGGQVPFRKSVLALPQLATPDASWMQDVADGWGANAQFLPPTCNIGAFYSDMNLAVQKVIQGSATPSEALKAVEEEGAERAR